MLLSLLLGAALAAETPKLPYRDDGACPFECCTYRDWKTEKPVTLHAEPSLKSPVIAKIAAGITVTAQTGQVITNQFGITKVLVPLDVGLKPDGKTPLLSLKPGDTIYTLHYAGEGYDTFWYRGQTYEEQIAFDDGGFGEAYRNKPVKIVSRAKYVWWAKLRTRDGKIGWTDQTRDFSNTDACG